MIVSYADTRPRKKGRGGEGGGREREGRIWGVWVWGVRIGILISEYVY